MRRVLRVPIGEDAQARLCGRTLQIAQVGNAGENITIAARARARRAEADRLWNQERTVAFDEITDTLKRMAPGNAVCMYCEHNEGSDIEHFWPKEKYPGRAYTWENYLWACGKCNTHFKGTQFPRDISGKPLLVDPSDPTDDPRNHLEFTPTTGKLVHRTEKGKETIRVLGFDRRGNLDNARRDAWRSLQANIIQYGACCDRGDSQLALGLQQTICRHPLASALYALFDLLASPRGAELIEFECRKTIDRYPEILGWP